MSQKIIRIGSSAGVTLSKSVLLASSLALGDEVEVSVNDSQITIKPTSLENDRQTLRKIDKLLKQYQQELDKLHD